MITSRISPRLPPGGAPSAGAFWVLRAECGGWYLDARTARMLQRTLARWWPPRWIAFTDLTGARVVVRRQDVRALLECTIASRAAERRLERALQAELEADRPGWMDEP